MGLTFICTCVSSSSEVFIILRNLTWGLSYRSARSRPLESRCASASISTLASKKLKAFVSFRFNCRGWSFNSRNFPFDLIFLLHSFPYPAFCFQIFMESITDVSPLPPFLPFTKFPPRFHFLNVCVGCFRFSVESGVVKYPMYIWQWSKVMDVTNWKYTKLKALYLHKKE